MTPLAARQAVPLVMALVAGFILRLYLAFATPIASESIPGQLSSYNDEIAHGNYALHLLQTETLPQHVESIQAEGALARGHFENYQPPLYYLIVAGISKAADQTALSQVIRVGRLVNCALFLGILLLFVLLCRELELDRNTRKLGVIFLLLSGVVVRFSATATNDVLFWLFGGIMIWTAVRIWNSGLWLSFLAVFFAASVAALYTKLSAILLLPLLAIYLLKRRDARTVVLITGAYLLILLVTLPLWFRNQHEFGSLFPLSAGFGAPAAGVPGLGFLTYALRSFVFPWQEFWRGWLGLLLMLPLLLGLLFSFAGSSVRNTMIRQPMLTGALFFAVAAFLWLNFRYAQAEARYLFVAWPAIALVFTGFADQPRAAYLLLIALLLPYGLFLLPALGI